MPKKGWVMPQAQRDKISASTKGRQVSHDTRTKIREALTKPDMRERLSDAARDRWARPEYAERQRAARVKNDTPEQRKARSERAIAAWAKRNASKVFTKL